MIVARPALVAALALAFSVSGCDRFWSFFDKEKEAPASTAAQAPAEPPAKAKPYRVATAEPERFTTEQQAAFDDWIMRTYRRCWNPPPAPAGADSWAGQVRIAYKRDGSLARPPKLVNPPSDPALKPQAKSVLRAVAACNPLKVPAQYGPFYAQWRTVTVRFDPQIASR